MVLAQNGVAARFVRIIQLCYRHLCTLSGVGRFFYGFRPAWVVEPGRDGEAGLDSLGPRLYESVRRIGSSVNGLISTCLGPELHRASRLAQLAHTNSPTLGVKRRCDL